MTGRTNASIDLGFSLRARLPHVHPVQVHKMQFSQAFRHIATGLLVDQKRQRLLRASLQMLAGDLPCRSAGSHRVDPYAHYAIDGNLVQQERSFDK